MTALGHLIDALCIATGTAAFFTALIRHSSKDR